MSEKRLPLTSGVSGAGIGLRASHYHTVLTTKPNVPWLELLSDNYMADGGLPILRAETIRESYPVTLHGVGLSLGSVDPLNMGYLQKLKRLVDRLEPVYVSDHLAWISINGHYTHDLLPLPYTAEAKAVIIQKIDQVQEYLGRTILIENPSSYLAFNHSEMSEEAFIGEVLTQTGCDLLLDVNNLYVSAKNHGFSSEDYLNSLPREKIKEIHLAGYENKGSYLFDTHGYPVRDPVWALYRKAVKQFGAIPTLIEWDTDIPEFDALLLEADKASAILKANEVLMESTVNE